MIAAFEKMGTKVFTNACGPCIGQWDRVKQISKKKIQLYILLIVTSQKSRCNQTHMPL
jgi:aconitase A